MREINEVKLNMVDSKLLKVKKKIKKILFSLFFLIPKVNTILFIRFINLSVI